MTEKTFSIKLDESTINAFKAQSEKNNMTAKNYLCALVGAIESSESVLNGVVDYASKNALNTKKRNDSGVKRGSYKEKWRLESNS